MTEVAAPEAAPAPPPAPERPPDIDLAAALEHDAPVIRLPADKLNARSLSLGEWAEAAKYGGADPLKLGDVLAAGGEPMYRAIAAVAYVLTLRVDPTFTWERMQGYRVEVTGPPVADPTMPPNGTVGSSPSHSPPDGRHPPSGP